MRITSQISKFTYFLRFNEVVGVVNVDGFDMQDEFESKLGPYGNIYKGAVENGATSEWVYFAQTALVNFAGSETTNKRIYKQSLVNNHTVTSLEVSHGSIGDIRRADNTLAYAFKNKQISASTWSDDLFFNGMTTDMILPETFRGYLPHQPHRIFEKQFPEILTVRTVGSKVYELTDHLGNVRVVITDRKEPTIASGVITELKADVATYNNYYAFGMIQPGRSYSSNLYRYGFNGMEKDDEVKGSGNSYTTDFRGFDTRIGRWWNIDPLSKEAPGWSPYKFGLCNPIRYVDEQGDFEIDAVTAKKYPKLNSYLKSISIIYINKPESFRQAFKQFSGLTDFQIKEMLTYGKGPRIAVKDLDKVDRILNPKGTDKNGITVLGIDNGKLANVDPDVFLTQKKATPGKGLIIIDKEIVDEFENAVGEYDILTATLKLESTTFHESTHYGTGVTGVDKYEKKGQEIGKEFEKKVYGEDVNDYNAPRLANPPPPAPIEQKTIDAPEIKLQ